MDLCFDAIAEMGRLIVRQNDNHGDDNHGPVGSSGALDWADPRLLGWSDLLATAIWPALDDATRARHAEALEGFAVAHMLNTARNADISVQLERVVAALNGIGIEPIVIKGASHLATGLWPTPGSRLLADIDLLVPPARMDEAFTALETLAGKGPQKREHPELTAQKSHMLPVEDAGGPAPVEIHHNMFSRGSKHVAPYEEIAARARPLTLGTARARVPAPTDRVLNAMLHGPAGSGTWLAPALHMRDLVDIALLAQRHGSEIDWGWIEDHLAHRGWAPALEITNRCLLRFTGMAPPFRRGRLGARLDARRWMWQLEHPSTRRFGRAANLAGYGVRSLATGGEPRRWALRYIRQPATWARAFRRYVLGSPE